MNYAIGIDIGGTKTAIGLVDQTGCVKARLSIPTDQSVTPHVMVERIATAVSQMLDEHNEPTLHIVGIGVGAPGPLNTALGQITCPPNLPGWRDFPLVDALRQHFSYPIRMENDATAATLAEKWVGAAQQSNHFVFVTISTGIGAGIYLHGKLITGATGNAGDVGHFVIDPSVGQCVCGQYGCWEWIASGTAIARQASAILGRNVTSKEAFELANTGHSYMKTLIDNVFRYIGIGCVTLINTLDPDLIVIGGGFSQVGASLFDAVQQYVSEHALGPSGRQTKVVPAALQQDAGLIGAAALIHMTY